MPLELAPSLLTPPLPPDSGYAPIIEDEEYMYVFFWESPLEVSDDRPVARVARVCKTDPGIEDSRLTLKVFSTFVKAQLICSSTPSQSDTMTSKVYPFVGEQQAVLLCLGGAGFTYRYHADLSFPFSSLPPSFLLLPHWCS